MKYYLKQKIFSKVVVKALTMNLESAQILERMVAALENISYDVKRISMSFHELNAKMLSLLKDKGDLSILSRKDVPDLPASDECVQSRQVQHADESAVSHFHEAGQSRSPEHTSSINMSEIVDGIKTEPEEDKTYDFCNVNGIGNQLHNHQCGGASSNHLSEGQRAMVSGDCTSGNESSEVAVEHIKHEVIDLSDDFCSSPESSNACSALVTGNDSEDMAHTSRVSYVEVSKGPLSNAESSLCYDDRTEQVSLRHKSGPTSRENFPSDIYGYQRFVNEAYEEPFSVASSSGTGNVSKEDDGRRESEECERDLTDDESVYIDVSDDVDVHLGEESNELFSCSICKKAFKNQYYLNRHMQRNHSSGGKRFQCRECGRAFAHPGALNAHWRTHTGERPFACAQCGRAFARADNLSVHMRLHKGERPYSCTGCGKCFTQSGHLSKHRRTCRTLYPLNVL